MGEENYGVDRIALSLISGSEAVQMNSVGR